MFELFKGKGSANDVKNFRDITCCDVAAKVIARPFRQSVMGVLKHLAPCGQFGGGLSGGGTDFTRLTLVAARDIADATKTSLAIVFVDLKSAFASVCRRLMFPAPGSLDECAYRLHRLGFEGSDLSDILHDLASFGVMIFVTRQRRGFARFHKICFKYVLDTISNTILGMLKICLKYAKSICIFVGEVRRRAVRIPRFVTWASIIDRRTLANSRATVLALLVRP